MKAVTWQDLRKNLYLRKTSQFFSQTYNAYSLKGFDNMSEKGLRKPFIFFSIARSLEPVRVTSGCLSDLRKKSKICEPLYIYIYLSQ